MGNDVIARMRRVFLVGLTLVAANCALALDIAGVKVADSTRVAGKELALNGAGIRTRLFFKVYVAALYAEKPSHEATALIAGPGLRRITMTVLRVIGRVAPNDTLNLGIAPEA